MKGDILLKQKKYPLAAKMFSAALKYPVDKCERLSILIGKASALAKNNSNDNAMEATNAANGLTRSCHSADYQIYQDLGDLYFDLGDIQKSVAVYKQAVDLAQNQAEKIPLMLKVAQCYWRLNQKENFLALNERISNLNDPFWSNLAKERMEEMNFNWEMQKTKAEWKKGEKS
jgi:tetratricopeptide (TPR) repeat protein